MFGDFGDFERTFAAMDELRRRAQGPQFRVADAGERLTLTADLPGANDKDVQLELTGDVLTVTGERQAEAPSGYSVHRRERRSMRFARSFTLPFKVDGERISAALKDGVLTVTLPKAPEAQPRQITVKAA
jgi:HSP20 family protein